MRRGPSMICTSEITWKKSGHWKKWTHLQHSTAEATVKWPSDKDFFEEGFQLKGGDRATSVGKVAVKAEKARKLQNSTCFNSWCLQYVHGMHSASIYSSLLSKARSPPASCHRWSFEKRPGTCALQYWLIHQRSQLLLYGCLCTLTGMWLLTRNG